MYNNIIIIPYRDREQHLKYFLENSWVLIKEHVPNTKIVIIEQEEGKLFNRGKLLNVVFKEYIDKTKYFITHDVDINPLTSSLPLYNKLDHDVILLYCPHNKSVGGICKFSMNCIKKTNGFPNNIWGWGIEDRALYYRCKITDMGFCNLQYKELYSLLPHKSNVETYKGDKKIISDKENYIFEQASKEAQLEHMMSSGLNNLEYTILERKDLEENVEFIKVSI